MHFYSEDDSKKWPVDISLILRTHTEYTNTIFIFSKFASTRPCCAMFQYLSFCAITNLPRVYGVMLKLMNYIILPIQSHPWSLCIFLYKICALTLVSIIIIKWLIYACCVFLIASRLPAANRMADSCEAVQDKYILSPNARYK